MIRFPRPFRIITAICAMAFAAACADRNPASAPPEAVPAPARPGLELRCSVDVRARTLACAQPDAAAGARRALLGGQGLYVRLASSGTAYDAGTGILRSDVTVENLTSQLLGTTDGYTPAPEGVRVFFASEPEVTSGSGTVAVENADGADAFTASGQSFFRYPGILAPGETTAPREWRFALPSTVAAFTFTVYVAAPVASEGGWVSLSPLAPSMWPRDTLRLIAIVHGVTGQADAGARVVWSTSNASVATVDSTGVVTTHDSGFAWITATSGARSAKVMVQVHPFEFPGLTSFEIEPAVVTADGADSVTFRVAAYDGGDTIKSVRVQLVSANNAFTRTCTATAPAAGTTADGVFACKVAFPEGTLGGVWRAHVDVISRFYTRTLADSVLAVAGAPSRLYVRSSNLDITPPELTSFTFSPDTARVGADTVTIDVGVSDADVGVSTVDVTFLGTGGPAVTCRTAVRASGTANAGVYRCRMRLPGSIGLDSLYVMELLIRDRNANVAYAHAWDLREAGFKYWLYTKPDTVFPEITAFSLSTATVAANGVDSVVVAATATDAPTGVKVLQTRIYKVGGSFFDDARICDSTGFFGVPTRSIRCVHRFNPGDAGQWRVDYVIAEDEAGNARQYRTTQLQALGWPTELTVTP